MKPLLLAAALLCLAVPARALPRAGMVQFQQSGNAPCIVQGGRASPIYVSPADFAGVARAANDLAQDIGRVSGTPATLIRTTDAIAPYPILVGTLGKSDVIDKLVADGKLDVSAIRGKWESYVIQTVTDPLPGVHQALVIAGSDKRGSIYGIYDISENIGVSPWYWWADVPVQQHTAICVAPAAIVQGPPAVKYRGIFINDEAPAMSGWAKEKFGGFKSGMYSHMFELLLRLHANYLWPAMWGSDFNEDDPSNPLMADEYGIVMGTSHHEPMMRSQAEFDHRYPGDQWDYIHHAELVENFWREGVRRNRSLEGVYTVGMRGRNDSRMLPEASARENMQVLEKIIARERQILAEEVSPAVEKIPQVLTLYSEVQDFYEAGMKVPDDITLLWSDDNYGDLRRVPTPEERKRSGGAGIYYHFDIHGGPHSYQWLNTNPLPKIQEQMNLAYRYGADRIWIVNVGDLKPMELPIEFFMTMAWNPNAMSKDDVASFTKSWARREFGPTFAEAVADIVTKYAKYNGWRKPDFITPRTFSLINYEEAKRVEAAWTKLVQEAEALDRKLPVEAKPAYFELVLHPTLACANLTQLYLAAARNALFAAQGRISANAEARRVRDLFARDQELSDEYNHLLGGKWNHMMDQTHIGYTSWDPPKSNLMPETKEISPKNGASLGVAVEGSDKAWPGAAGKATLPAVDNLGKQRRWIDVFSRGTKPASYTVKSSASWLAADQSSGDTTQDRRLHAVIDWKTVPAGRTTGTLTILGDDGESITIEVPIVSVPSAAAGARGEFGNLTEAFTIPASAAARNVSAGGMRWDPIPDYGRVGSAMEVSAVTALPVSANAEAPHLEYEIYVPQAGTIQIDAVIGPTLAILPGRGLHLALSLDGNKPQVVDGGAQASLDNRTYTRMALDGAHALSFQQTISQPGRHVIKVWMVDPAVVLEYLVVGAPRPSYFGPPARGVGPDEAQ